jgi:hypothetical protein
MENKSKGIKRKREEEKIFDVYKYCPCPEEFRKHPIYKRYEISSKGRFRLASNPDKINNGTVHISGYIKCKMFDKKSKHESLSKQSHCLVIETFGDPKPSDEHTVDHLDGYRDNNCICNLRWATKKEQAQHQDHSNKKGNSRPLYVEDKNGVIQIFHSIKEAAQTLNININTITRLIKNTKRSRKGGYRFYFIDKCDVDTKEWKLCMIDDIEYKISTDGWVHCPSGRLTIGSLCKTGYRILCTKYGTKQVHFLVLSTFNPKENWRELKLTVNHIDGNKENNHISNLEWCTMKEQMVHASGKKIEMWSKDQETLIKTFKCIADAAREMKINRSHIIDVLKKRRNHAGGYYWKYANEVDSI